MDTITIIKIDEVMAAAKRAKEAGSTRFCMGAAWRELGNKKKAFNNILDMVSKMHLDVQENTRLQRRVQGTYPLLCTPRCFLLREI